MYNRERGCVGLSAIRIHRRGTFMPHPKRSGSTTGEYPPGSIIAILAERSQLDFELDFYSKILATVPDFAEVLRVQACNYTLKGLLHEGLAIDEKLVAVRPTDPTAHYNLACRYALLQQPDKAISTLRKAVELGYRDFAYMEEDQDLDSIRKDPRFRKLLKEFAPRSDR